MAEICWLQTNNVKIYLYQLRLVLQFPSLWMSPATFAFLSLCATKKLSPGPIQTSCYCRADFNWIKLHKFSTKHGSRLQQYLVSNDMLLSCQTQFIDYKSIRKHSKFVKNQIKKNSYFAFDNSYFIRHPKSSLKLQSSQLGTTRGLDSKTSTTTRTRISQ